MKKLKPVVKFLKLLAPHYSEFIAPGSSGLLKVLEKIEFAVGDSTMDFSADEIANLLGLCLE